MNVRPATLFLLLLIFALVYFCFQAFESERDKDLMKPFFFSPLQHPTLSASGRHSPRSGNIGHITRIANKLVQLSSRNDQIQSYLQVHNYLLALLWKFRQFCCFSAHVMQTILMKSMQSNLRWRLVFCLVIASGWFYVAYDFLYKPLFIFV